ncbi:MAG: hypothetical protein HUK06_07090, partial [Bacteroidaceae bacterium]|nr:hypothetical protein [Bacteroidaceae bacterium]
NNQGVSVAKTVDDETRQVFKILRDYTNTADATEHDDAVRDIRRKLWHEYRNRKEALEDYGEDSKEYNAVQNRIDGLKAELTPLGAAQQETRFAGYGKTAAEIDNYL